MTEIEELHGVLPALVTPLRQDGTVDEPAIGRLVEHVLAGGVHGLLALGSTGETASLDEPSRRLVLAAVVRAAGGRVPVICGVAQTHLAAARAEVAAAAELGAVAALVTPPFYYPIDQATVLGFYRRLAAESPLPILVYNIPQFTKVVGRAGHAGRTGKRGHGRRDKGLEPRFRILRAHLPGHSRAARLLRLHRERHDAPGVDGHGRGGHDLRRRQRRSGLGGARL